MVGAMCDLLHHPPPRGGSYIAYSKSLHAMEVGVKGLNLRAAKRGNSSFSYYVEKLEDRCFKHPKGHQIGNVVGVGANMRNSKFVQCRHLTTTSFII